MVVVCRSILYAHPKCDVPPLNHRVHYTIIVLPFVPNHKMDRELVLEKHLLSRSYASNAQIKTLLDERYSMKGGQRPFLALTPADELGPAQPRERSGFWKLGDAKPSKERKTNTRHEMKVYIKNTLQRQDKIVKKAKAHMKTHSLTFDPEPWLRRYQIPQYKLYQQLNQIWRSYIQDLVVGDQRNPNLNMVLPKLSTADYNGCELTVLESRNRNLVGIRGIVLYDAQHSFIVVVPQKTESKTTLSAAEMVGGIRILPKKATLFGFEVDTGDGIVEFTILGTRFELRSVDRSAKKFKSHNVEDIY